MWIQCKSKSTRTILDRSVGMTEPIVFSSEGKAQVSAEIGSALVAKYKGIDEVMTRRPTRTPEPEVMEPVTDAEEGDEDADAS